MNDEELETSGRVLESRRFSSAGGSLPETRMEAILNIRHLVSYLESDPKTKLRLLFMGVRRYLKSNGDPTGVIDKFISTELAKLILEARTEMENEGGTINKILGLSRYGPVVNKAGVALSRIIRRISKAQEKQGFIPKNLQKLLNESFNTLVSGFKDRFTNLNQPDELEEETETTLQTSIPQGETYIDITLQSDDQLSEIEKNLLDVGIDDFKVRVDGSKVRFLFNDELDKQLLEEFIK